MPAQSAGGLGWYWPAARAYHPRLKRFLQPGPSEQDGVQSYAYCHDDPVDCSDPSGLVAGPLDPQRPGDVPAGDAGLRQAEGAPSPSAAESAMPTQDFYAPESGPAIPGDGGQPKVVAVSTVGGRVFIDTNQGARPAALADEGKPTLISDMVADKVAKRPDKPLPNGDMATAHAEVGTIQQAYDAGVTVGADIAMSVEGLEVCQYCPSDVRDMAMRAGLRSITIKEVKSGDTLYWGTGMNKFTRRQ